MTEAANVRPVSPVVGWRLWLGLASLGALILVSDELGRHLFPGWAQAALAAGVAGWMALSWSTERREPLPDLDPRARGPQPGILAATLAAAGIAFWTMPTEEFGLLPTLFWIAAMALWFTVWRSPRAPAASARPARSRTEWIALCAVLAAAVFFSFWRIGSVPPNPVSDHAEEMLDMLDLAHGRHAIFFMRNLGVAPLHFYWTYLFTSVLGLPLHYLTVKIATSAFEVGAVFFMYLAGRELGGAWLGIVSAALVAWGKWPFSVGRQGLEYAYAVLPTIVVVWALSRFLRRGDRASALAAGAGIGIGLCAYPSFRVVPLLVPLALVAAMFDRRRRGQRWRLAGSGLLIAFTAAIVCLPLLVFALRSPQRSYFWSRSLTRLTSAERAIPGERLQVFAGNLWNMARAFHWQGSSTWTVMLQDDPFLDVVTGGLLLAGVALVAIRILRGSWRWSWLPPALFVLTLPSTLSLAFPNENPSLNRAGPAIPVVFLIAGASMAWLGRGFAGRAGLSRAAGLASVAALLIWSAERNGHAYFVEFGRSYDNLIEHSMEMAAALREEHAAGIPYANMYLLAQDFWVDGRNIAFQIDDPAWADNHLMPQGELPKRLKERPLVFLYHPSDLQRLDQLQKLYPGTGRVLPQTFPDRNFGVYVAR